MTWERIIIIYYKGFLRNGELHNTHVFGFEWFNNPQLSISVSILVLKLKFNIQGKNTYKRDFWCKKQNENALFVPVLKIRNPQILQHEFRLCCKKIENQRLTLKSVLKGKRGKIKLNLKVDIKCHEYFSSAYTDCYI